ncbi:MAG TPA: sulfite reductase subunit alpha [Tepidisphaeraceae bacterium]|nr:sulfite reductase subunit alpha [Tepidisphaeraceae bacterium]
MIPENAPFSPSQRAWLNGFFAAVLGARASGTGVAPAQSAPSPGAAAEEEFPWHDSALSLDERLKLAEGKKPERQLMAAMAQLDCGACGSQCKTYAEAIASGAEKDLTRCSPGGRETAKALKQIVARVGVGTAANPISPSAVKVKRAESGYSRLNPFPARLLQCRGLNSAGSSKDTRLIAFDLKGSGLTYHPGDAVGIWPENCPDAVNWVLEALDAGGDEKVAGPDGSLMHLRDALLKHYSITKPSAALVELMIASTSDAATKESLSKLIADDGPGIPEGYELLDLLKQHPSARPPLEEFASALLPVQPRLYSISSSLRAHPDEVHLTVGIVRFLNSRGRQCKGVASTYLAERIRPGQKVRMFVQSSHGFRLPKSSEAPIIMVGPGTGIAPFRAFLQERKASGATGQNWLFFGDQTSEFDFLYQNELEGYHRDGVLHRLTTAFSRDQERKVYVQHRMRENGSEIWSWLQRGGHLYVCGDAKRMAADVDHALKEIVAEQGRMSPEQAKAYVSELAKSGRYQRDVY